MRTLLVAVCRRLCENHSDCLWWQMDKAGQTFNRLMGYDCSSTQTVQVEPTDSTEPWTIWCWPEPCHSNMTHPQPRIDASRSLASCDFTSKFLCSLGKFEVSVFSSMKVRGSTLDSLHFGFLLFYNSVNFIFVCKMHKVIDLLNLTSP